MAAAIGDTSVAAFEQQGIVVRLDPPRWDASCGQTRRTCVGSLGLAIDNRSAEGPFSVERVELAEAGDGPFSAVTPFKLPAVEVPKGMTVRRELVGVKDTERPLTIRLLVRLCQGDMVRISSPPFVLPNPTRAAAKSACKTSGGTWKESSSGAPYCAARSHDGGKVCRDGLDCEGLCLFDRYEPLAGVGLRPVLGHPVGHCSSFMGESGCAAYIERGASSQPPIDVRTPAPQRCSD